MIEEPSCLIDAKAEVRELEEQIEMLGAKLVIEQASSIIDQSPILIRRIRYDITVVPLRSQNRTAIGRAIACSIIKSQPEKFDFSDDFDTIFLKEARISLECVAKLREWMFSDEERHALLSALEQHWIDLVAFLPDTRMLEHLKRSWERMIREGQTVIPDENLDVPALQFLIERELDFIGKHGRFMPRCGCRSRLHREILEDWKTRNLKAQ